MAIFERKDLIEAVKWTGGNLQEVKDFLGAGVLVASCDLKSVLMLANLRDSGLPESNAAVVFAPAYICRSLLETRIPTTYKFFLFSEYGDAEIFWRYYQERDPTGGGEP